MKYYMVAELKIRDPSWISDYVGAVSQLVEDYGGRFLARTTAVEQLEGEREPFETVTLIEWPSREAALAFYESDEYRPYRGKRRAGAENEMLLVAGEDMAGEGR